MCGVIGLIYEKERPDLGRIAAELLEALEYRGYDSTGAAIQGAGTDIQLAKGVGAPSVMVEQLGIVDMAGQILCGQVRWATFGAVDDVNAQPHHVQCKCNIYGAHNGNVTNCDDLKAWLTSEGHQVLSDNDGEMVVHAVEHYFARELDACGPEQRRDHQLRRILMRTAICSAATRLRGSYAAVIVDPESRTLWAIKQGSSLYFGLGRDKGGDQFTIASSDLSAVLRKTRVLVPLSAGEFVEYRPDSYQVYNLLERVVATEGGERTVAAGDAIDKKPVRSRLLAKDTALLPPFETFMDQEISAQEQNCQQVITLFAGGTEAHRMLMPYVRACRSEDIAAITEGIEKLRGQYSDDDLRNHFHALVDHAPFRALLASVPRDVARAGVDGTPEQLGERLFSSEAGFFTDLMAMSRQSDDLLAVRLMDVLMEAREVEEFASAVERFAEMANECLRRGGRIYAVCCGSSYNASKAAALFFDEIARTELIPILPGEFRAQCSRSLTDGDLFVAVSQSGETKDLIDIMNDLIDSDRDIGRVALVNNINSTLAQEKSELVIPLRCGPEIAVPATKSFMNQMVVFYCLALHLAERRIDKLGLGDRDRESMRRDVASRREKLPRLPELLRETFESTRADIERAAQLLFLCPSIHILATRTSAVAKEGALKVREVVLNHTEGFEGSEFKHGPNTILGFNTVFGPLAVDALLKRIGGILDELIPRAIDAGMGADSVRRLAQAVTDAAFSPSASLLSLGENERALLHEVLDRKALIDELYADYPLIYITGPDPRDVHLTISQVNTHKIRGSITVVIAEEHTELRRAASKAPAGNLSYHSVYITLPRTNDTLMAVFSSTVVLQRLALEMSLLKMNYLDRLGIKDHGVHPDVPKNVSKSITVD